MNIDIKINGSNSKTGDISLNPLIGSRDVAFDGEIHLDNFIRRVESAESAYDIFKLVKLVGEAFGFSKFLVMRCPPNGSVAPRIAEFAILTNWSSELLHECIETKAFEETEFFPNLFDPGIPVTHDWHEKLREIEDANLARTIETLINSGHSAMVYLPCRTRRLSGGICFAGDRNIAGHEEMKELHYRAVYLFDRLTKVQAEPGQSENPLSEREIQCLQGIAAGMENADIGDNLGLSPHTIAYHATSAIRKLRAKNKIHALVIAIQNGWLAQS